MSSKVTVYVPCRNYGRFLREALESVIAQSLASWELIVFTEGSSDETAAVARAFRDRHPDRVRLVETGVAQGLRTCANQALEMARGEYVMRLDADDVLDESALLVLSGHLDRHPDTGLVFPNWIYVSEDGEILGIERRRRLHDEVELLDLPPHGACTMIRKRVLKSIGGYDPQFEGQDGHELWLRTLHRFKAANVPTPLFSYRKHASSMSRDAEAMLAARRAIKRSAAGRLDGPVKPRCVAIIPARNRYHGIPNAALGPIAGRPLLDFTLDCANACGLFDLVHVTTDDAAVVAHCAGRPATVAQLRDPQLSGAGVRMPQIVRSALDHMETRLDLWPDVVAILNVHTPLRRPHHVREAVDTLLLHQVDHVISTYEDHDLHFRHGRFGLEPINPAAASGIALERQALFTGNGALHVSWRDALREGELYEGRVGHVVMSRIDSIQTKHPADRSQAEALLLAANGPTGDRSP